MGLRTRILGKVKSVLGGGGGAGGGVGSGGFDASGLPNAMSPDGYKAVAKAGAVTEGGPRTFQAPNGRAAGVFLYKGKLYCIDNECRHEDGPVSEGLITDCRVKCPYHDWEYDFTTGACTSHPENKLETYHVREKDGFLWIGPLLTKGTDMRGGEHNDGMKVIVK